jgi:hypothetical protein
MDSSSLRLTALAAIGVAAVPPAVVVPESATTAAETADFQALILQSGQTMDPDDNSQNDKAGEVFEVRWSSTAANPQIAVNSLVSVGAALNHIENDGQFDRYSTTRDPAEEFSQIDADNQTLRNEAGCDVARFDREQIEGPLADAATQHGVDLRLVLALTQADQAIRKKMIIGEAMVRGSCNAASAAEASVAQLQHLTEIYENPLLVAAAHHAGSEAVSLHGGIPPSAETVSYVAEVAALLADTAGRSASTATFALPAPMPAPSTIETPLKRRRWIGGVLHF